MSTLIFICIMLASLLTVSRVTAYPFAKTLMPSAQDEISNDFKNSVDSLDSDFEMLMNGIISTASDQKEFNVRPSEVPSRSWDGQSMHRGNRITKMSLFQESWRYEDYMRDWYDDDEIDDDGEYYSET
ncbi:hypothetical protein BGW37DRAFT_236400 [Umbelopsis sp. PMI_123]|nr:hypothetical protein BGW37DRAFT_236400 [Umbelopsis sp. PMI_123]